MLLAGSAGQAGAQVRPAAPATVSAIPDDTGMARLVWSTMAAVDHANKTGNYAVLRGLGSPAFQASNGERALAGVFAGLRDQRINLSDTLSVEPSYEFPPGLENGLLRIRGAFRMRPQAVQFDLLFQWNQGWMLQGIAVRTVPFSTLPPAR